MQLAYIQTVSNTIFSLSRGISKSWNKIQKPQEKIFGKEWAEYAQSQKNQVFKIKWYKERLDHILVWCSNNRKQETVRNDIRDGQVQITSKSTPRRIVHFAKQLFDNTYQRTRVGHKPKDINQALHIKFNKQKIRSRAFLLIK